MRGSVAALSVRSGDVSLQYRQRKGEKDFLLRKCHILHRFPSSMCMMHASIIWDGRMTKWKWTCQWQLSYKLGVAVVARLTRILSGGGRVGCSWIFFLTLFTRIQFEGGARHSRFVNDSFTCHTHTLTHFIFNSSCHSPAPGYQYQITTVKPGIEI